MTARLQPIGSSLQATYQRVGSGAGKLVLASAIILTGLPVFASPSQAAISPDLITSGHILTYAAFIATLAFSIVSTFYFMRSRGQITQERDKLASQLYEIRARSERYETLIQADDQRLVIWSQSTEKPSIVGTLPETCAAPSDPSRFIAFGRWLAPASAAGLERHIAALRSEGSGFQLAVSTPEGNYLDAYGRSIGGRVFVRFRDLSGDQQIMMALRRQLSEKTLDVETYQALLEEMHQPVWLRRKMDDNGEVLHWANHAYLEAVGASQDEDRATISEFLDSDARRAITRTHENNAAFKEQINAVSKGARKRFDVVAVPTSGGSISIATDVSAAENAQAALTRTIRNHEKTLNELTTAVAIFDRNHRLAFHNKAYRELFGLDEAYLVSQPTDSEVIDKLRSLEKLPVEANFREWKKELLNINQRMEIPDATWHLPDGQTLRVIASPRVTGGITWIYENLTAQLDLESRVNVLSRLQDETLNRLTDGVAVFSSDGQLTLSNSTFGKIWRLDDETRGNRLHINKIADTCIKTYACAEEWHTLKMAVVGVSDNRDEASGTMDRPDGSVVAYSTNALIDGRTMVTFDDITDSVNFERALLEKNEALNEADKLKNDFVQNMSYELRSPLTNIIGFTQLLSDADMGPLTQKQKEYTDYILSSSQSVLAIINNILDLATADAGVLELNHGDVSIQETINSAVEGLKDRLIDRHISLSCKVPVDIGTFIGDEQRMVQILFNLLSNAIQFSEKDGKIILDVSREDEAIIFVVRDWGKGIPKALVDQVFNRFESHDTGAVRGGVGLGLAMVKRFVELHDGNVDIDSTEGEGTTVTCTLPASPPIDGLAA